MTLLVVNDTFFIDLLKDLNITDLTDKENNLLLEIWKISFKKYTIDKEGLYFELPEEEIKTKTIKYIRHTYSRLLIGRKVRENEEKPKFKISNLSKILTPKK